jgi:hypothetical protein
MVSRLSVSEHARRVDDLVSRFANQVDVEIDAVVVALTAYIVDTLVVEDGVVKQIPENSAAILHIDALFQKELNRSGFYAAVVALVSNFVDQVDEFRVLYEEMSSGLPEMSLDENDSEVLANQAAAAMGALEGQVFKVNVDLRQLLTRSLGELKVSELVQGVNDVVRKLNRVEPIARDQLILFFRMVGNLVYSSVEETGRMAEYHYVGPDDDRARDFCSTLVGNRVYSRMEIDSMDNGQVAGVFSNCGGHGCRHWWALAAA